MTPSEKRDRREARHAVQAQLKQFLSAEVRLRCTNGQLRDIVRKKCDQYFKFVTNHDFSGELSPASHTREELDNG